jgi:hypothetical protein
MKQNKIDVEHYITTDVERMLNMYDDYPKLKCILKKIAKKTYELECLKNEFIDAQMAEFD